MAYLAPSLKRVFADLDSTYPSRDRRTDGWYRAGAWTGHDTDHMAAPSGVVRAIDIDKDGIWAWWVASQLARPIGVVRYVIYDRMWAHARTGFTWEKYSGTSNPHTDHIHVSIEHTLFAENYSDTLFFVDTGGAAHGRSLEKPDDSSSWDYSSQVGGVAGKFADATADISGYAQALNRLRSL